jgi:hypothetical protein
MRKVCTHIAEIAVRARPLARLADWPCMSVMTQGSNFQLDGELIRKARV